MKKFFVCLLVAVAAVCHADLAETRLILGRYCEGHQAILEKFDKVAADWTAYQERGEGRWEIDKLLRAVEYAAEKHHGQVRKDAAKTPYIIHPIGVAELLWDMGGICSVNLLTASLLHDTLEDTDATEEEIRESFGSRVLATVKEVTNDPNITGEENKQRQIEHAPEMSLDAQLVKLADRLYNVRDLRSPPPAWTEEKVDIYYGWGEKMLHVLKGTNRGLENSLKREIQERRKN